MERDRSGTGVGGAAAGLEEGDAVVVEADAHLDGDRHGAGVVDGGGHHGGEQAGAGGHRGATAVAGDLRGRAAEVEIDVVDMVLGHEAAHGSAHHGRVGAVELERATGLLGTERGQLPGLLTVLHETPGVDHLAHEQAVAEPGAQRAEREVGDAGHGGEHHRRIDGDRTDRDRGDGARTDLM